MEGVLLRHSHVVSEEGRVWGSIAYGRGRGFEMRTSMLGDGARFRGRICGYLKQTELNFTAVNIYLPNPSNS